MKTVHFEQVYLGAKIEDFGLLKNDHNQLSKASEIIQEKKLLLGGNCVGKAFDILNTRSVFCSLIEKTLC